MSARRLGLKDRGTIALDNWADLVVFDPDTIADGATFDSPIQPPVGIGYVIVNGEIILESGEFTGAMPGRVLRHIT